ncbi:Ger(x)C family spore germination protein [Bacillus sp. FSL M8-0168]|uniref:Ger(x)C family spore germination protein n=1 Tax=Bacillus sp. FSL M8-0168 TaxID=2921614 RepID=UPI0030FDC2BC
MTQRKAALLCIAITFLLTAQGCSPFVENNEIEEISPVTFWFIKEAGNGKLSMSTLVPPIGFEEKRIFNKEVKMVKQFGKNFDLNYYNELKNGQLRMVMIEERLARKGIIKIVNSLLSDAKIGPRLYLIIVNGDFDKYMTNALKESKKFDFYLYQTLRHYEKASQGEMSIVNLHHFKNQLYTHFSDPYAPVFQTDGYHFKYEGTALFQDDKLANVISGIDDQTFQIINNNRYLKYLPLPGHSIVLGQARSAVYFELNEKKTALTMNVSVNAGIEEYDGEKNLQDQREFDMLVQDIESELERRTACLLKKMQQVKADPLEIGGEALFPFTKPMSDEHWEKLWENMDIKVRYQVKLRPITNTQ